MNKMLTLTPDQTNTETNLVITAVQNSSKCNASTSKITVTKNKEDEPTQETNLFNLNNINRVELQSITYKLREIGILDADETLEQWLSIMMPQITDGDNLTVPELLAGLRQFLEFE